MQKATVKELTNKLYLSESRIRAYLGMKGAPTPVVESVSIGNKGRIAGKYDVEEVRKFINENKFKRKKRLW